MNGAQVMRQTFAGTTGKVRGLTDAATIFRRSLLIARLMWSAYVFVGVLMGTALLALGFRAGAAGLSENAFMLSVFAVVASGMLVASGAGSALASRRSRNPVVYAVASSVCSGLASAALAFGFVSAFMTESITPYLVMLVPVAILWGLEWPRAKAWERWAARPSPHRTSAST